MSEYLIDDIIKTISRKDELVLNNFQLKKILDVINYAVEFEKDRKPWKALDLRNALKEIGIE